MSDQSKIKPLDPSEFFGDNQSARSLVPGTIPRGYVREDRALFDGTQAGQGGAGGQATAVPGGAGNGTQTGQSAGGQATAVPAEASGQVPATPGAGGSITYVVAFPITITQAVLLRGQERFDIYCSPCHSRIGDGLGIVVRRGFTHPPSFHIDRLRQAAAGYLYDTSTNGTGAMPPYAGLVPVYDRWAIVAYIRALQFSQHATLEDVPADQRERLE